MIAIIRIVMILCYFIFVCVFGCLYCLVRPFHRDNVYRVSMALSRVAWLLGVKVEVRVNPAAENHDPCVYVANHQNSLDMFLIAAGMRPGTVTLGKKSIRWIPLFGQLYWWSGNILIDRQNKDKAFNTIAQTVKKITEKRLSVWIFAEGTRSYGRGLLPLKSGAFHTAAQAQVPIVPLCMSTTHRQIKLNRWYNGKIIIEIMAPVTLNNLDKGQIRETIKQVQQLMTQKIAELDQQITEETP